MRGPLGRTRSRLLRERSRVAPDPVVAVWTTTKGAPMQNGEGAPEAVAGVIVLDEEEPPTSAPRVSIEASAFRIVTALMEVERTYWRELVCSTHQLSRAAPVLFSRHCGRIV